MKIFLILSLTFIIYSQENSSHYLNISGFSYHVQRQTDDGKKFNEINYGIGYRFMYQAIPEFRYSFDMGLYYDSGFFWTKYVLLNLQPKIYHKLFLGIYGGLLQTQNLNDGELLFAVIPGLSYQVGSYDINMIYFPKIDDMNKYDAFAFFLSIKL